MANSSSSATVTWTPSTVFGDLIIEYQVFRNNVEQGARTRTTTFTDTGLAPETLYSYQVEAFVVDVPVGSGRSVESPAATILTTNVTSSPTGLTGSATRSGVVLNWNAVDDADEYIIYRDGDELNTTTGTTYTDTEVALATSYRYSVSAVVDGEESDQSPEISVTSKGDGSGKEAYWVRDFRDADLDYNEVVDFEEFLLDNTNPRKSWVLNRHRFLLSDEDESEGITLDEYTRAFGGKRFKKPTRLQKFLLADEEDGDGLLDPFEFANTINQGLTQKNKWNKIMKKFDKLDKNDSDFLSQTEFKIRGGTSEDDADDF